MNPAKFNPSWNEAEQVDWFLFEFAVIPDDKWGMYHYELLGRSCALGHCGERNQIKTNASSALDTLIKKYLSVDITDINDNSDLCPEEFRQITTPKARVLKALEVIAEMIQQKNKGKS